jgi:type I restriction enzyme, R subunit
MTASKFNEDTLSEKPAIEQLKRMKYEFVSGEKLDPQETEDCERGSRRDVVLVDRLRKKLVELNPGVSENAIQKAVRRVTAIQGTGLRDENKNFSRDLLAGISEDEEQKEGPRRKKTIHFIDF